MFCSNYNFFKFCDILRVLSNLKWDTHIELIVAKAYKILGLIKQTLLNAPQKVKLTAYNHKTLCSPILEYAAEVWDPHTKGNINSIEMLQSRAVRFIQNLKEIVSILTARGSLDLQSLEIIVIKKITKFPN